MQETLFQAQLSDILDRCTTISSLRPHKNLITLIDALAVVSTDCDALRTKLLSVLSSAALREKAWNLVRATTITPEVECSSYNASMHREALAGTISLLLGLTISARPNEPVLPRLLATALIAKQRNLPHASKLCLHAGSIPVGSAISLFQQESTPFTGQHLQDWRDRLKSELESQNSYQRDSIVRSVAQICQDLEIRCNTVEEPLRREKAKSQQLEQRVEELSEQVSSLESQAADDRFHLDGLEDEKLGLADEKDRISAKFDELRLQLEKATRDADESLRSAQETFNTKELELRSAALVHEEQLRSREDEVRELSSTVSQVRESLEHTEEELRAFGERCEDLQSRLGDTSRQLNDEREAKLRQSEEALVLKERAVNLEYQLQTTEAELEAVTRQLSNLEVSHQELKQSSEDALRELEVKHTTDLDVVFTREKAECDKLKSKLTETLHTSRQLEDEHSKTREELHTLRNTCSVLEAKTHDLEILCEEQEEELEELRTLRKNVLASMGLATQNPLTSQATSRSNKNGLIPETPRDPHEHRRRKSATQPQNVATRAARATHGHADTAQENFTEASIADPGHDSQGGSTPKRQKPHPSFKVPTMQTPFAPRPTAASRSTSKRLSPLKRSALRQMSPNRRHTTVGFALSETGSQDQAQEAGSALKMRGSHLDLSQEDFTMDDSLVGTPFTPGAFASGTGRVPINEDDATTTEL